MDLDYLLLRAALRVLLAVNFIRVDAAIFTVSPVAGLRPSRAADLEVLKEPKPGHATFSPFLVFSSTTAKNAVTVFSASALVTPDSVVKGKEFTHI